LEKITLSPGSHVMLKIWS